jgi:2-keto-4-pentenoate hydratase/2-oxohepta-3-ene-1,7-dioic acid hydratase in catechol pathway
MRWSGAQVGHGQPIVLPVDSSQFDYEAELAVVIGKAGRHICTARAFEHVAGYSCFGDHSLRDFQRHTAQATPGKNFDRSGAFGPWLISTDEVPDPQALEVIGRLNGEEVQRDSVSHMIFSIPELIAYLSSFCELQPGDVIATGTPAGVALGRQPPRWMTVGDRFEIEIPGVGRLANTVVPEPSTPSFYDKT